MDGVERRGDDASGRDVEGDRVITDPVRHERGRRGVASTRLAVPRSLVPGTATMVHTKVDDASTVASSFATIPG